MKKNNNSEIGNPQIREKQNQAKSLKKSDLQKLRSSEEWYRKITTCTPNLIWTMNLSGRFIYVNKAVERTHGWTADEYLNLTLKELVSPQQFARNVAMIEEELAKTNNPDFDRNATLKYESEELRKDGTTFLAEVTASFLWSDDGKPFAIIGITRDITERKKREEILQASENKFKMLTEKMSDMVWILNTDLRTLYVTPSIQKLLGFTQEERMSQTIDEQLTPDSLSEALETLASELALEGHVDPHRTITLVLEFYHKDGSTRWMETTVSGVRNNQGALTAIHGVSRDITENKKAQDALRQSEERLRGIAQNLPGIIFQFYAKDSGEYGMSYANERVLEFLGMKTGLDDLFPSFLAHVHEEDRERLLTSIKTATGAGTPWNFEGRVTIKSGEMIWFQGLATSTRHGDQMIFDGILLDITARKLAEEKSQLSEENFRTIFMMSPNCVALTSLKDGLILDVNQSFENIVGWERTIAIGKKATGPPMNLWVNLSERDFMVAELKSGGNVLRRELIFRRSDGKERVGVYSAKTMTINKQECIVFILQDITERKLLDEKLQRTLESLRKSVGTTIQVMISAIEMRDPYTAGHQLRVADIARAIATEMGLSPDKIDGIRMVGTIHDIGKMSIPTEILSKPTKLTKLEYALIQEHSQKGYEMLKNVESPWPLAEIVHQHHERINGTGYPQNLKGDEILLEARILAVADVVEAMASHRPYRASLGIEAAIEEIEKNKAILYDTDVVDACLKLFREQGFLFE